MTSRDARRRRIVELVGRNRIDSQEQLLDLLAAESITTTQATLSRDLRSLGVVKGADGYEVLFDGTDERAVWKTLGRSLAGLVEHVAVGGTMVVLRTRPGFAAAVAGQIDAERVPQCLGAIAGHDTVFLAVASTSHARDLHRRLARLV